MEVRTWNMGSSAIRIFCSESLDADGATIFAHACEMGTEGIVSKRDGSRYRSDRTNDWIKSTCQQRETLAIVGYALKENRFDGLYLGRQNGEAPEHGPQGRRAAGPHTPSSAQAANGVRAA
jgi:ATP-dependent DNA ligase